MTLDLAEGEFQIADTGSLWKGENLHALYQKAYTPWEWHAPIMAYGSKGFPWTAGFYDGQVDYSKGICPVAEKLHDEDFLGYQMCLNALDDADVDLVAGAFEKVWANLDALR